MRSLPVVGAAVSSSGRTSVFGAENVGSNPTTGTGLVFNYFLVDELRVV